MARPPTDGRIVLDAARGVLLARGLGDVRVDLIAAQAGVSRATVYRSVGGRDDIVRALLLEEATVLFQVVDAAVSVATSPVDVVGLGVAAAMRVIDDRPLLHRLANDDLDQVMVHLTTRSRPLIAGATAMLVPVLTRARLRDALPAGTDVPFLSEELVRYVIGLLVTPTLQGSGERATRAAERASRLFGRWVLAADGAMSTVPS